jgi:hypothetical protein
LSRQYQTCEIVPPIPNMRYFPQIPHTWGKKQQNTIKSAKNDNIAKSWALDWKFVWNFLTVYVLSTETSASRRSPFAASSEFFLENLVNKSCYIKQFLLFFYCIKIINIQRMIMIVSKCCTININMQALITRNWKVCHR